MLSKRENNKHCGGNMKVLIKKPIIFVVLIAVAIAGIYLYCQMSKPDSVKEQSGLFFNEKVEITNDMVKEELAEVGELITEKYFFTQSQEYSKAKTSDNGVINFFSEKITKSTCIYQYDGEITAGFDMNSIQVDVDKDNKLINVTIPKSTIQSCSIDYESFQLFDEKNGLFNKLDMSDFNEASKEFEESAKQKAIEKGLLDRADDNAKKEVKAFLARINTDYKVEVKIDN